MIKDKLTKAKSYLKSDELTANQKKLLIKILVDNGASQSFVYVRFFSKGFAAWELQGVDSIKREFITEHKDEIWKPEQFDSAVVDGYCREAMTIPGEFWRAISRCYGLRKLFVEQLRGMGMSYTVVMRRFRKDNDWKRYEKRGMLDVMAEYDSMEHTCDETEQETDAEGYTEEKAKAVV